MSENIQDIDYKKYQFNLNETTYCSGFASNAIRKKKQMKKETIFIYLSCSPWTIKTLQLHG